MKYSLQEEELKEVEVLVDEGAAENKDLVVLNDDFNTFEHVINVLIKICEHSREQAEQCTWIIHYKGKCAVKKGSYEELKPKRNAIREEGIGAVIQ